jgi:Tfp pilus assembly protein PilP
VLLVVAAGIPVSGLAATADLQTYVQQKDITYEARGRRDPFVQPSAGRLNQVIENINIENLRLTGVIRNPKQAMALFASQTGTKFGYVLKGTKLYRENHQAIPGITGKVLNPKEVLLKQGEKQIVFKLRSH